MRPAIIAAITAALLPAGLAEAREIAVLKRVDAGNVELVTNGFAAEIWLSDDEIIDAADQRISGRTPEGPITIPLAADKRRYVILKGADGTTHVVAERVLPLEQASNFRDIGGYMTKDGRTVRWGKAYRSGAMPLLTEADYALVDQLDLDSIVDLRSMDERQVSADEIDDRTGALFLANDYGMKTLMGGIQTGDGENMYRGMEKLLAPQYRALFKRLVAGDGAVLYHCSAGQDRTGIATALIYDLLGVDRETILQDYHLSTGLRRPEWEMPDIDPKDYPGNFIVQYYTSMPAKERKEAQPLYTASGASHLAQFFAYLDTQYGGTEAYTKQVLGLQDADIAQLRTAMLR